MRSKADEAVRQVRHGVAAGRLSWTYHDVKSVIVPCPERKQYDDILRRVELDDPSIPEGERPWDDEDEAMEETQAWDDVEDAIECPDTGEAAAPVGADPSSEAISAVAVEDAEEDIEDCSIVANDNVAQLVAHCTHAIKVYEIAKASFEEAGGVKLAIDCQNAINTERRRLRALSQENPAVVKSIMRIQDAEAARDRKRRRDVEELNSLLHTKKRYKEEIQQAKAAFAKEQQKLKDQEDMAALRSEMPKIFSPEMLGQGAKNPGQEKFRKQRFAVLDRLSRLGQGLSPPQRHNFSWFKENWDEVMCQEYGEDWGLVFSSLVQGVLDEISKDVTNAFSVWVYNETRRVLEGSRHIAVPG